jgi:hypothetical protein
MKMNSLVNRSTHAAAESLNAKIKDFSAQLRGVLTRNSFHARFLAMPKLMQAWFWSFGLTKTFFIFRQVRISG